MCTWFLTHKKHMHAHTHTHTQHAQGSGELEYGPGDRGELGRQRHNKDCPGKGTRRGKVWPTSQPPATSPTQEYQQLITASSFS